MSYLDILYLLILLGVFSFILFKKNWTQSSLYCGVAMGRVNFRYYPLALLFALSLFSSTFFTQLGWLTLFPWLILIFIILFEKKGKKWKF